jgi:hypothetical protein
VEGPAEDPLGGGEEGDREVEELVEGPGPPGGRALRAAGAGLPVHHGRGKVGVAAGEGGRCECGVRAGAREGL